MMVRSPWCPEPVDARTAQIEGLFRSRFGRSPSGIASAPGRVNLIGEHIDYNGGLVLPLAIDRSVLVAFGPGTPRQVEVYSSALDEQCTLRIGSGRESRSSLGWAGYVHGVAELLSEACKAPDVGARVAIESDVPVGAGLSSSAALEVAVAGGLRALWGVEISDRELALLCQRAEHEYAGVQCGVMDQFAVALCRPGHALMIDCASLACSHLPLGLEDQDLALVIVDSGQRRRLEGAAYNARQQECDGALRLVQAANRDRKLRVLCDASLADLERTKLPAHLERRARHVVTEQERVKRAKEALSDGTFDRLGRLMNESHASLRDDFEVSTPELDLLVGLAQETDGVLGARLTGAGFGGCTVQIVESSAVERLGAKVQHYERQTGRSAQMMVCRASSGLQVELLTQGAGE